MFLIGTILLSNLIAAAIVLMIGTIVVVRNSVSANAEYRQSQRWIPIATFFAGPLIALAWWTIDHFFADHVLISDSWELLPPVLAIGTVVGIVASAVFATVLGFVPRRKIE